MRLAVLFAEGSGECLRQGQEYVPKLLLPLGGMPLLEHQLAWLAASGFQQVNLCLGCKADRIRAHFGDGSRWGLRLQYSVEETPLGTAGCVKALGAASLPEDILVLHGEVYCGPGRPEGTALDYGKMLDFHAAHQGLATLAVQPSGNGHSRGSVIMGPERRIMDFPLPSIPGQSAMAVSNLWIIRRQLLRYIPDDRPSDFLLDVFPAALRAGETMVGYPEAGLLADLAQPALYESFAGRFKQKV